MEEDISIYDQKMTEPTFWDDSDQAQKMIEESNTVKSKYNRFTSLSDHLEELKTMVELLEMDDDEGLREELEEGLLELNEKLGDYELEMLLSDEHDDSNAILEIQSGAGGTEAQDWASMLYRMYRRWSEQRGFSIEVISYHAGDEAGIKSVTILIKGENAYGLLKSEQGVHRLVRISPFDSQSRRHTSFVSVEVSPELDDSIEIEISPDELRIDTYRASGAGGQHVNVTDSAVRITHEPSGIIVASQAERSQLRNRETAMQLLKSKLYQREQEKKEQELAELRGEQMEMGWGSQIRSYVFHPYSMVKDHRTDYETGNTDAVMDGDIDPFIEAYLKSQLSQDEN